MCTKQVSKGEGERRGWSDVVELAVAAALDGDLGDARCTKHVSSLDAGSSDPRAPSSYTPYRPLVNLKHLLEQVLDTEPST